MAEVNLTFFESLAQGVGYASSPAPTSDGPDTSSIPTSAHTTSSLNEPMSVQPHSDATITRIASDNRKWWSSGVKVPDNTTEGWLDGPTWPTDDETTSGPQQI